MIGNLFVRAPYSFPHGFVGPEGQTSPIFSKKSGGEGVAVVTTHARRPRKRKRNSGSRRKGRMLP